MTLPPTRPDATSDAQPGPAMRPVLRFLAALAGQPVDRTPCAPALLQQGARLLGLPLVDHHVDPERLAEGQVAVVDRFGVDAVFAYPHLAQDGLPFGAKLQHRDGALPILRAPVIERYEDLADLVVPDPTAHPYLRRTLQAAETLAGRYHGERLVVGGVVGPFSLAGLLLGSGPFLALVRRNLEYRERYLERLMDQLSGYATAWANAQLAAGCDLVVVNEGLASAPILDPETFERDVLPPVRRVLEGATGRTALELAGDTLPFARQLRDLPTAAHRAGVGDDLVALRRELGGGKALLGSLSGLKLLHWRPERIEAEARALVHAAGPGFVLGSHGAELPGQVPDANIEALLRSVA